MKSSRPDIEDEGVVYGVPTPRVIVVRGLRAPETPVSHLSRRSLHLGHLDNTPMIPRLTWDSGSGSTVRGVGGVGDARTPYYDPSHTSCLRSKTSLGPDPVTPTSAQNGQRIRGQRRSPEATTREGVYVCGHRWAGGVGWGYCRRGRARGRTTGPAIDTEGSLKLSPSINRA